MFFIHSKLSYCQLFKLFLFATSIYPNNVKHQEINTQEITQTLNYIISYDSRYS